MARRRWGAALWLLPVVSLCLAACGGGSEVEVAGSGASGGPSAGPAPEEFVAGVLAREWLAHGRSIDVDEDGSFEISYRVYRWCSTDPAPCDSDDDGLIGDGGHVTGTFDAGTGTGLDRDHHRDRGTGRLAPRPHRGHLRRRHRHPRPGGHLPAHGPVDLLRRGGR